MINVEARKQGTVFWNISGNNSIRNNNMETRNLKERIFEVGKCMFKVDNKTLSLCCFCIFLVN